MKGKTKKYRLLRNWVTPWCNQEAGTVFETRAGVKQVWIDGAGSWITPAEYPDWFAPVEPEPWRPKKGEEWDIVHFNDEQEGDCACHVLHETGPHPMVPCDAEVMAGRVYPPGKGAAIADEINALLQKRSREHGE